MKRKVFALIQVTAVLFVAGGWNRAWAQLDSAKLTGQVVDAQECSHCWSDHHRKKRAHW